MKFVTMVLLLITSLNLLEAEPAPLLDFSPYIPIELSPENRKNLEDYDAKNNIAELNKHQIPWWPLTATLLMSLAILLIRKLKHIPSEEERLSMRVAQAKTNALKALYQLQATKIPTQEHCDRYFVQLSNILRQYLENRYQLHTPVETTPEFLKEITHHPQFNPDIQKELAKLLNEADNVKFAKHSPTLEEYEEAQSATYNIIQSTP